MIKHKSFFLVAILVALFVVTGCQPVSIEQAEAQLCADLAEFKAAVGAVEALDADATVDEADAALALVDDAWEDVENSIYLVSDARYENLDQAYEDLDDAVRMVDDDDTLQEAATTLQEEVANVNVAYDEFYQLQCGVTQ